MTNEKEKEDIQASDETPMEGTELQGPTRPEAQEPWLQIQKVLHRLDKKEIDFDSAMSEIKRYVGSVDARKCWVCGSALKMHFRAAPNGIKHWDGHTYESGCVHIPKNILISIG